MEGSEVRSVVWGVCHGHSTITMGVNGYTVVSTLKHVSHYMLNEVMPWGPQLKETGAGEKVVPIGVDGAPALAASDTCQK